MSIRNSIAEMRSGVIGSLAYHGPIRAMSKILKSTSEIDNKFGNAFCLNEDGTAGAGGEGVFLGILTNPHAYAIDSTNAKNGTTGELLHFGELFVRLVPSVLTGITAAVPIVGSKVFYTENGDLTVDETNGGVDDDKKEHKEIKGAIVTRHDPKIDDEGNYIAVVSFTGLQ